MNGSMILCKKILTLYKKMKPRSTPMKDMKAMQMKDQKYTVKERVYKDLIFRLMGRHIHTKDTHSS